LAKDAPRGLEDTHLTVQQPHSVQKHPAVRAKAFLWVTEKKKKTMFSNSRSALVVVILSVIVAASAFSVDAAVRPLRPQTLMRNHHQKQKNQQHRHDRVAGVPQECYDYWSHFNQNNNNIFPCNTSQPFVCVYAGPAC